MIAFAQLSIFPASSSMGGGPCCTRLCPWARARARWRLIISFLVRLLFAAYFLEAGIVLLVLPWSPYWDRNLFVTWIPAVERLLGSPYARGAVSGVGVITAIGGLLELAAAFGVWGTTGREGPKHGL